MTNPDTNDHQPRVPQATYRLQFNRHFTLRRAIELVPYLRDLGISHVYASPLLKACPGSLHGYDTCDHSQINPEVGTEKELEELVAALRRHEMGLVLDIVPNHMGVCGRENRWWWDVLKNGRASRFAEYFDIDWESPDPRLRGKVLLPVLGDFYGRVMQRGELKLACEQGEFLLCYYEHRFPIYPETMNLAPALALDAVAKLNADPAELDALIQKQHYRLAGWRHGNAELNYRRFFDISTLAGIRVEDPRVFGAAHALVLRWYANGWIDGFRVDHPDGLHDPTEYFERLRAAAPHAWIIAEKILQPGENIAVDWPVAGTTGYEFMRRVTSLFVDPAGEKPLTDLYVDFTGEPTDYGVVVREKQRLVLRDLLEAEVNWLTRLLLRIAARYWRFRDLAALDLREALIDVTARLPVYCTYVQAHLGRVPDADAVVISETVGWARQRRPELPPETFDFIADLLLLRLRGETEHEFVMRFQQLTGPTMAKGAEDTACYCFNRLIALNIVSGDPSRFSVSPAFFHDRCVQARRRWPDSMLTTSTHDTKRSEDVRMRICLLSEIPAQWRATVLRWYAMNKPHRRGDWPDRNIEYFYYQTLIGAWPLPLERALLVMEKAAREAKQHTSWTRPNSAYDEALRAFVTGTLGDASFTTDLEKFVFTLIRPGCVNSLAQTLLKLTAPGVPDIYQGTEFWDLSLVDPDNRRLVDFEARRASLAELAAALPDGEQVSESSLTALLNDLPSGRAKQFLIWRVLNLRRNHASLFARGEYRPVAVEGDRSGNVVAFARIERAEAVLAVVPRLVMSLIHSGNPLPLGDSVWGDTSLRLPEELEGWAWRNVLTGEQLQPIPTRRPHSLKLADVLRQFPVALLRGCRP